MFSSFEQFSPLFYKNQDLILEHLKDAPTLGDHSLLTNEYRVHIAVDTSTKLLFSTSNENNENEILTTIQLDYITVKILHTKNPHQMGTMNATQSENLITIPRLRLFIHTVLETDTFLTPVSIGHNFYVNINKHLNWHQLMPQELTEPIRMRWADDQIRVMTLRSNAFLKFAN